MGSPYEMGQREAALVRLMAEARGMTASGVAPVCGGEVYFAFFTTPEGEQKQIHSMGEWEDFINRYMGSKFPDLWPRYAEVERQMRLARPDTIYGVERLWGPFSELSGAMSSESEEEMDAAVAVFDREYREWTEKRRKYAELKTEHHALVLKLMAAEKAQRSAA